MSVPHMFARKRRRTVETFERAYGVLSVAYDRECVPEKWTCLGMRERNQYCFYYPLRCWGRGSTREEAETNAQLGALMAERGNKKFEFPEDRSVTQWQFVSYPPVRDNYADDEPVTPTPTIALPVG